MVEGVFDLVESYFRVDRLIRIVDRKLGRLRQHTLPPLVGAGVDLVMIQLDPELVWVVVVYEEVLVDVDVDDVDVGGTWALDDRREEMVDHVDRKSHLVEGRFEEVVAFEEDVVRHPVGDIVVEVVADSFY